MNSESNQAEFRSIQFSGRATEYFGIWIVNVLLSLATLGIYSAWAKVRRVTYFNNNTSIAGYSLGYHATGKQLLIGRVISFVILLIWAVTGSIPFVAIPLLVVMLFLTPWLLNNSMRFSGRMTSYRNVRFNWQGTYWKSFWFLVIAPFLGVLTLGLLTPLFSKYYYRYIASRYTYGTTRFSAELTAGRFYWAFLVGGIFPTVVIAVVYSGLSMLFLRAAQLPEYDVMAPSIAGLIFVVPAAVVFSMVFIYRVLCRNLMVSHLVLSDVVVFNSKINPIRFVWISLTNLVAVVFSLGLLLPWAQVRKYRYLSNCTEYRVLRDVDQFIDDEVSVKLAFGEEFAEFEGIEVVI